MHSSANILENIELSAFSGHSMWCLTYISIKLVFGCFFDCTTQLVGSSSQTRDQTRALAVKAQNPNHWTTKEFPKLLFFKKPKGGKSFMCRLF